MVGDAKTGFALEPDDPAVLPAYPSQSVDAGAVVGSAYR
jgi:hypothetical protein